MKYFRLLLTLLFATSFIALGGKAEAQSGPPPPTFSKMFSPSTIGPGAVSELVFTIDNSSSAFPVVDLAFTDVLPTLPGAMTIADPADVTLTCAGLVSAPDGGGTISMIDGELGAGEICEITVKVTASTPGVHTNPAITLFSAHGTSMSSSADLTVVSTLPGFTKAFSPSSIPLGGQLTLTFTIDNSANAAPALNIDFTNNFPTGIVIDTPANASTTCGNAFLPPVLTAVPGTSTVVLNAERFAGSPSLEAGATCTVTVDVIGTAVGTHSNTTELLVLMPVSVFTLSAGSAHAALEVTVTPLAIFKNFTDDPVGPGQSANVEFTITNFDRIYSATNVSFTDDLLTEMGAGFTFGSDLGST